MNTKSFFSKILISIVLATLVLTQVGTPVVSAQSAAPLTEKIQIEKNGQMVTVMVVKGFDVNEFGGDDSLCQLTASQPETIHIGEVVGSPNEKCKLVVEWSLKQGDRTVATGVYATKPGEWFYVPLAVSGVNDEVRVVGTIHRLPKLWNAHMYAAFIGYDRDQRDGTESYVGLSPTDPWVRSQIDALSGRANADVVTTNTLAATSTPTAPAATATIPPPAIGTPTALPVVPTEQVNNVMPVQIVVDPSLSAFMRLMGWFALVCLVPLGVVFLLLYALYRLIRRRPA